MCTEKESKKELINAEPEPNLARKILTKYKDNAKMATK